MRRPPLILGSIVTAATIVLPSMAQEAETNRSRVSFAFELQGGYDDNITELSDRDKDRVGDPAFADRFKIEAPGDYVWAPSARLGWSADFIKRVRTSVQLDAKAYRYTNSSVKNYEVYALKVEQDLTAAKTMQTRLALRVSDVPDYYLRELRVPGTTDFASESYHSRQYGLALKQIFAPKLLSVAVQGSRTNRNYDSPFNERDGDLTGYGAEVEVGRLTTHAGLVVGYLHSRYDAKGDNGSTLAIEPDISSDRDELNAQVAFRWALGYVTLGGTRETRDYTTDNATDIYHFDRSDTKTIYEIEFRQGLPAGLYLELGASREENVSHLAPGVSPTLATDVTDYTRDVVTASLGWRFRTGPVRTKDSSP